MVKWKFT